MKIVAEDYKGKWFVLYDEDRFDPEMDSERPEIDVQYVLDKGLEEHVGNCDWYGIPAYIGKDQTLHERIKKIEERLEAKE